MSWQNIRAELLRRQVAGESVNAPTMGTRNWIDEVGDDYVILHSERTGRKRTIKAIDIERLSTPNRRIKLALKTLETKNNIDDRLAKSGVPSYLIPKYVAWIGSLATKQKSADQIWSEFTTYAIPLMTEHLKEGDPVTRSFVKNLMTPHYFQN
jgi:hypothetical protein